MIDNGTYPRVASEKLQAAGAPADEIEITPEMIEAGVAILYGYETLTRGEEWWAVEVYRSMWKRSPGGH
jgi:hypothetical protein